MAMFEKGDVVELIQPDGGMSIGTRLTIDEDGSTIPWCHIEGSAEKSVCINEERAVLITNKQPDKPMALQFNVGDIYEVIEDNCVNCPKSRNPYIRITKNTDSYYCYDGLDKDLNPTGEDCSSCYRDKHLKLFKPKQSFMNKIITFVKNATLSANDKLLRKHGLQDECGNVTEDAKTAILLNFYNSADNQAYLLTIAEGLEAEAKDGKSN